MPNPLVGLVYHWTGGLAAASFYIPYRKVKGWAWETYWLVGGFFSWIVAPLLMASLLVPGLWDVLRRAPAGSAGWAFFWGLTWGVGMLAFGLSMRYLGIALGYAIALGLCTAFGTLVPPVFQGKAGELIGDASGRMTLLGIGVCLAGIALSGMAGVSKERDLAGKHEAGENREFHFLKGLAVATFSGVLSAAFAFGLAAGKPIAEVAKQQLALRGGSDLWQNLPVLVVVLLGGFTTNFVWCAALNLRNRTTHQYASSRSRDTSFRTRDVAEMAATEAVGHWDAGRQTGGDGVGVAAPAAVALTPPARRVPLAANYLLSAAAGVIWYLQFFFYGMGQTRMGRYEFSSWTLHMASIIIFSTLWGVALKEWKGTSRRTHVLVALGLAVLVLSTLVIGYGNYLKGAAPAR